MVLAETYSSCPISKRQRATEQAQDGHLAVGEWLRDRHHAGTPRDPPVKFRQLGLQSLGAVREHSQYGPGLIGQFRGAWPVAKAGEHVAQQERGFKVWPWAQPDRPTVRKGALQLCAGILEPPARRVHRS